MKREELGLNEAPLAARVHKLAKIEEKIKSSLTKNCLMSDKLSVEDLAKILEARFKSSDPKQESLEMGARLIVSDHYQAGVDMLVKSGVVCEDFFSTFKIALMDDPSPRAVNEIADDDSVLRPAVQFRIMGKQFSHYMMPRFDWVMLVCFMTSMFKSSINPEAF